MQNLETVAPTAVVNRLFIMLIISFVLFYVTAKLVGPENKAKWFKKRAKYTFFNRRGIFGEDINFGYPRTIQGLAVAIALYGVILGGGFWFIFILGY